MANHNLPALARLNIRLRWRMLRKLVILVIMQAATLKVRLGRNPNNECIQTECLWIKFFALLTYYNFDPMQSYGTFLLLF